MGSKIRLFAVICVLAVSATACSSELTSVESAVYKADARNRAVQFTLGTKGNDLQYCVEHLKEGGSAMDVFRVLLQSAKELKERTFDAVSLCFRGTQKFVLKGADFKTLGEEYGTQNVMYTIRTFPEKLSLPDGKGAYEHRQGGVLYLVRVQMEDFTEMNNKWFLDAIRSEEKAKIDAQRPKVFAKDTDAF